MKRMIRASKESSSSRKVFRASKSLVDMIDAFEGKLQEMKVDSNTHIEGAVDTDTDAHDRSVEIDANDADVLYRDLSGGFGDVGEIISLADIKNYWNMERNSDPGLVEYDSYYEWFDDTRNNYLQPVGEEYFD